jgi:hypothetical protein
MLNHNMYGACSYRDYPPDLAGLDYSADTEETDKTPCLECLAEEKGDAMRDEQKDPDWGGSYDDDVDEEPRRCGLDN